METLRHVTRIWPGGREAKVSGVQGRDAKFEPSGPVGPKVKAAPFFFAEPDQGSRAHAGLRESDRRASCSA